MTKTRDPLSVRFDGAARQALTLVIEQHEKHKANTRLRPYLKVTVPNGRGKDNEGRDDSADQLSPYERAFLRALYYDARIWQWTARKKPNAVWSLKRTWGPPPAVPGRGRSLTLEVFPHSSGHRKVKDSYKKRAKYTENMDFPGRAEGVAG